MIKKQIKQFFSLPDTLLEFCSLKSDKSMTRLIFFLDSIACIVIAILALCLQRDLTGTAALIGALLGPVSVTKFIQSKYEEENSK